MEIICSVGNDADIVNRSLDLNIPLIDSANRPYYKNGLVTNDITFEIWRHEIGIGWHDISSTTPALNFGEIGTTGLYGMLWEFPLYTGTGNVNMAIIKLSGSGFDPQTIMIKEPEFFARGKIYDANVDFTGIATDAHLDYQDSFASTAKSDIQSHIGDLDTKIGIVPDLGSGASLGYNNYDLDQAVADNATETNATANKDALIAKVDDSMNANANDFITVQNHLTSQDTDLTEIKGTGFDTATDSLVQIKDGQSSGGGDANIISVNGTNVTDINDFKSDVSGLALSSEVTDATASINTNTDTNIDDVHTHLDTSISGVHSHLDSLGDLASNIKVDTDAKLASIQTGLDTQYQDIATIVAKLPTGTISNFSTGDTVDGVSIYRIFEYCMAMFNGRYEINKPAESQVTFYKRDNDTPLSVVTVDDNQRTRDS